MSSTIYRIRFGLFLLAAVALLIMMLAVGSNEATGRTITVDDEGNAEYEIIQEAIDSAENGDTVRVWEGTYYENVVVDQTVNIVGNGSEVTTIAGGGKGNVVSITANGVNMSGFKVMNGSSGISLRDSIYCTIEDNIMNENGISISGNLENWNLHTIDTTNTVNGKPVYYYKNITGLTVPYGAGQVILANCSLINVENQNCSNGSDGILVGYSSNIKIENNTCSNNDLAGISLGSCSDCTITNNTCEKNDYGIVLDSSSDCTITNNTMNENSISIFGSLENCNSHTIDTKNTVNGKPVYYYKNVTGLTVPYGAGQVILANCSLINVENQNCSNSSDGILVGYSSDINIENNTCSNNNWEGIILYFSSDCTISNNTCSNNNWAGIILYFSSDCTITNNTNSNNYYGISIIVSDDCTIMYNTCSNNEFGIRLQDSSDCKISNNTSSNNNYEGISLDTSSDCTITNNTCSSNNNWAGISLHISSDCILENNTISGNRVGINLQYGCQANTAHYNNIYNNTEFGIDASNNTGWSIDATNNYWGAASGPYHPTTNPGGEGGNITDDVEFEPWLEEEVNWPPIAHVDQISPNPAVESEHIRFVGHGTDDGSIIGYAWRSNIYGEFYNGSNGSYSTDELPPGEYIIYFKVQDNHGVWSDEVSTALTITKYIPSNHIPTVTITSPTNNSEISGTITIKGSASDENGDKTIEKVELSIDGGEWVNVTGKTSWNFTWDTTKMENGVYIIRVRCYDGEDHSGTNTITLIVENEKEKDDDGGFIPGFDVAVVIGAVIICCGFYVNRKS